MMNQIATFAKNQIRNWTRRFGYEIHKYQPACQATPINVFRLVVQDYLSTGRSRGEDFFFLQIGAHDGMHFDPIYPWVRKHHWRGLLVEPQPRVFKRLQENYRQEPQLSFENAAVYAEDGKVQLYIFAENQGLPEHATMLASLNREALAGNGHGYKGEIQSITVPALSVSTLLAKHKVNRVDLLQIDTEGYDFQILGMFLRQTSFRPNIIQFESGKLSSREYEEAHRSLDQLGYRTLSVGVDTIAYLQTDDSDFARTYANQGYSA